MVMRRVCLLPSLRPILLRKFPAFLLAASAFDVEVLPQATPYIHVTTRHPSILVPHFFPSSPPPSAPCLSTQRWALSTRKVARCLAMSLSTLALSIPAHI